MGGWVGLKAYLGDDKVVLDRAHVVVIDRVRGHEAPGVELQGGVVEGGLFNEFPRCCLEHFFPNLNTVYFFKKKGERGGWVSKGRGGWVVLGFVRVVWSRVVSSTSSRAAACSISSPISTLLGLGRGGWVGGLG